MNNVSWFLYFTDVVRALQVLFGFLTPAFLLIGAALVISSFSTVEERKHINSDKNGYGNYETVTTFPYSFLRIWGILSATLAFLFCVIAILIPSRDTMYMIAASQIGEQIIQLEEVQQIGGEAGGLAKDAIDLLRQQIQEQLVEKPAEGS